MTQHIKTFITKVKNTQLFNPNFIKNINDPIAHARLISNCIAVGVVIGGGIGFTKSVYDNDAYIVKQRRSYDEPTIMRKIYKKGEYTIMCASICSCIGGVTGCCVGAVLPTYITLYPLTIPLTIMLIGAYTDDTCWVEIDEFGIQKK